MPAHRIEVFHARVDRWLPDLIDALTLVYDDVPSIARRLLVTAATAYRTRADDLHALDLRRSLEPDWFQSPRMVGYAAYADRFAGTLRDVAERAEYLRDLGVTYLHLLPLLEPRPAPNDGGYAVKDYRMIRTDLGTTTDLRMLTEELRRQDISLCVDLVLNHVAREHEWAQKARAGDLEMREFFHIFADRELPDAYEQTVLDAFPDLAPGSFTWDEELGGWVWTTFNSYQWDVNWANPSVLCEYAEIVLELANHGVEVFRLDAIAYLWKRLGTNCQSQPEVHALTQALRTIARIACPAVIFKAEAIVGPHDLVAYLGTGRHYGKVSDLAYHNSLMAQVWSMIAAKDVRLGAHALRQVPATPRQTSWVTYARCHDDIGWAISDEDAAAVGLSGREHRSFLSDFYSGDFPGSWARGVVFQEDSATGDRRISGSLASLAGLELNDPHAEDRILLVSALVLGFGGIPVLWMGDELALLNDYDGASDPAHAGDNRWLHRHKMDWQQVEEAGQDTISSRLRHLIAVRKQLPQLHGSVVAEVLEPHDPGVLLVLRRHPQGPMLGAYNFTPEARPMPLDLLRDVGLDERAVDHVTGRPMAHDTSTITLAPYAAAWLTSPSFHRKTGALQ